jgi:hypothetical protein
LGIEGQLAVRVKGRLRGWQLLVAKACEQFHTRHLAKYGPGTIDKTLLRQAT